ncbi:MAG TPA: SPOR domain-containing protein [Pyrinomonadaceae bacterium]|jgi:cell division protein FtsN
MRVTCPKCQSKGLLDSTPLLNKAHMTCARCGAAYDVLSVGGEVLTTLSPEHAEAAAPGVAVAEPTVLAGAFVVAPAGPTVAAEACAAVEVEDVLMLPNLTEQPPAPTEPAADSAAVLELADAPAAEPQAAPADVTEEPIHAPAQTARAADASAAQGPSPARSASAVSDAGPSMSESGSFEMPPEYAPQLNRADLARPGLDKYSLGVRLMRVSPVWLLACGLAFIGLVVLLNGLTGSAEQLNGAQARAAQPNVLGNQASNQNTRTAARPAAAAPNAKPEQGAQPDKPTQPNAQTSAQPAQPAQAAAQQSAAAASQPAAASQAAVAPTQAEQAKQPAAKPAQPAPQTEGSGSLTLQVGSYNNPVEANGQVERLKAAGFAARVVAAELPQRGTWYRVQTGRFADRAEAARYGAQLKAQGAAGAFIVVEVGAR